MLHRLAVFLHVFHFVLNKLENQPGVGDITITNELHSTCKNIAKSLRPSDFVIDLSICELAVEFLEIFNKTKLLLAGYNIDICESVESNFKTFYKGSSSKILISGHFANVNEEVLNCARLIMLNREKLRVRAQDITKRNKSVAPVISAFDLLAKY